MIRPVDNDAQARSIGAVVQAGTVTGGVHIHQHRPRPAVPPRALPAPPRWLVAREREIAHLDRALRDDTAQLPIMAIEGAGGVGKTTLALHWLHRNTRRFRDGQLYADLRGFDPNSAPTSPMAVAHGFLLALGVEPNVIPADQDARLALYRSLLADRRSAILLDNAADTAQVEPLLPGSPSCAVIVTSRSHLGGLRVRGAASLRLDVLPRAGSHDLLSRYLGEDVVDREPAAVAAVVESCAGLPLALTIAAARSSAHPHFPLSALADELRHTSTRLDAFDAGDPSANLRAVISLSYKALDAPTARLFRLMGLLPTPEADLPALAGLAGLPSRTTADLLRELERKNLVQEIRPRRFGMHSLVRLFAGDMSEQRDVPAKRHEAMQRLVDHFAHSASVGDTLLYPHRTATEWPAPAPGSTVRDFTDGAAALAWFSTEHETLLAVQRVAVESGRHDRVWQVARALDTFLHRRGHLSDNVSSSRLGVTAAEHLGDGARLLAYRQLGRALTRTTDVREGRRWLERSLELGEAIGDVHGQAHTHHDLARTWALIGDHDNALAHSTEALARYRAVGNAVGEAHALNAMGWHYAELGDVRSARSHCAAALTAHDRLGNRSGALVSLDSLGSVELRCGRHAEAVELLRRARGLCRDLDNTYFEAIVTEHLARAYLAGGDHANALDATQACLDLYTAQHRTADADRIRQAARERP
ncbi:ATP-binding protein [Actinosynnema sp. CS-041913]|uniref:ATP-binding protein n=1 Tax=Actinosynnema sp. CS-041913 TaxID=3239917 RepID=UPI003D8EF7FB